MGRLAKTKPSPIPTLWPLALAILLSLAGARAYRTAGILSPAAFVVTGTDQAALALLPGGGDGNAAGTARLEARRLVLDFSRGYLGSAGYGFAAGDRYRFRGLFQVVNRAPGTRDVYVHVPGGGVAGLAAIYGRPEADPNAETLLAGTGGACAGRAVLPPGAVLLVDFEWDVTPSATSRSFTVTVAGADPAVSACPG